MSLQEKIEEIQRQPEHIRRRYVLMCLSVAMVFIVGIWILSLKESFMNVKRDIPAIGEEGKAVLPSTEGVPSLTDLVEQAAPLRIDTPTEEQKKDFVEQQMESRKQGTGGAEQGEGMMQP